MLISASEIFNRIISTTNVICKKKFFIKNIRFKYSQIMGVTAKGKCLQL